MSLLRVIACLIILGALLYATLHAPVEPDEMDCLARRPKTCQEDR